MLFILIPIAWLAMLTVLVAICRAAADGDAEPSAGGLPCGPIGERLVLSQAPSMRAPHTGRAHRTTPRLRSGQPARRRRVAAHGIR